MNEDRSNEPLDKAAETAARIVRAAGQTEKIAHSIQAVHAATGAVRVGGAASGATVGTALGGPLGTLVGALLTSKTVWKVIGSILLAILLFVCQPYFYVSRLCRCGCICVPGSHRRMQ